LAQKARQAQQTGAVALLVVEGGAPPVSLPNDSNQALVLPVVGIGRADGDRLRGLAAAGPVAVALPSARPWGGLEVWDIRDPARPVRRAVFRTLDAQTVPPPDNGWYTVHNPLALGRYALASWSGNGVRLLDVK